MGEASARYLAERGVKVVLGPRNENRLRGLVGAICEGLREELAGDLRVTTLPPGFTATGFADHIRNEALRERIAAGGAIAMPPEAIAEAIAYAIGQPAGVNIGEIVIRPTAQA